jgi:hypothetical protein
VFQVISKVPFTSLAVLELSWKVRGDLTSE